MKPKNSYDAISVTTLFVNIQLNEIGHSCHMKSHVWYISKKIMVISPIPPQLKFFQPGREVLTKALWNTSPTFFKSLLLSLILCIRSCLLKCTQNNFHYCKAILWQFVPIFKRPPNIKCLVSDFSSGPADQYFSFSPVNMILTWLLLLSCNTVPKIPKYRMCLETINILYIFLCSCDSGRFPTILVTFKLLEQTSIE